MQKLLCTRGQVKNHIKTKTHQKNITSGLNHKWEEKGSNKSINVLFTHTVHVNVSNRRNSTWVQKPVQTQCSSFASSFYFLSFLFIFCFWGCLFQDSTVGCASLERFIRSWVGLLWFHQERVPERWRHPSSGKTAQGWSSSSQTKITVLNRRRRVSEHVVPLTHLNDTLTCSTMQLSDRNTNLHVISRERWEIRPQHTEVVTSLFGAV